MTAATNRVKNVILFILLILTQAKFNTISGAGHCPVQLQKEPLLLTLSINSFGIKAFSILTIWKSSYRALSTRLKCVAGIKLKVIRLVNNLKGIP
jgi:hypothetical protein